jgi:hypothetical protein
MDGTTELGNQPSFPTVARRIERVVVLARPHLPALHIAMALAFVVWSSHRCCCQRVLSRQRWAKRRAF